MRAFTKTLVGVLVLVALATADLASATSHVLRDEHQELPMATLNDCLLQGVNFPDDSARMIEEGWVPRGYRIYGDGGAILAIWTFACDQAKVAGRDIGSVKLSFAGVVLEFTDRNDPMKWPTIFGPGWPGNWGFYVVQTFTDKPPLARRLHGAGIPSRFVENMSFEQGYATPIQDDQSIDVPAEVATCSDLLGQEEAPGLAHSPPDQLKAPESVKETKVHVGAGSGSFDVVTSPLVPHNPVTHCHDQLLWHGEYDGKPELRVLIPVARDHFCHSPQPACGSADPQSKTRIARFLNGQRSDPRLAFDHEPIREVLLFD